MLTLDRFEQIIYAAADFSEIQGWLLRVTHMMLSRIPNDTAKTLGIKYVSKFKPWVDCEELQLKCSKRINTRSSEIHGVIIMFDVYLVQVTIYNGSRCWALIMDKLPKFSWTYNFQLQMDCYITMIRFIKDFTRNKCKHIMISTVITLVRI